MRKTLTAIVLMILSIPALQGQTETRAERIREHEERIQGIIEQSKLRRGAQQKASAIKLQSELESINSDTTASAATQGTALANSISPSMATRIANWEKFEDFYYTREDNQLAFTGATQEYENEAVKLNWEYSGKKGKLTYQWLKPEQPSKVIELNESDQTLLLRNQDHCVSFNAWPEARTARIQYWTQPEPMFITSESSVLNPKTSTWYTIGFESAILVTPEFPQTVNNMKFYVEPQTSMLMAKLPDGRELTIGDKPKDKRPLDNSLVSILKSDPVTSSITFYLNNIYNTSGTFAITGTEQFEEIAKAKSATPSIVDAFDSISAHFGFTVEWATEVDKKLASQESLPKGKSVVSLGNSSVLYELDIRLENKFDFTILDSSKMRIAVSPLYQYEKASKAERAAQVEQAKQSFKSRTHLYRLNRLSADIAEKLAMDKISRYYVLPNSSQLVTSESVVQAGKYFSIVRTGVTLDSQTAKNYKTDTWDFIGADSKIIADPEGKALIVIATEPTQQAIRALLEEMDPTETTAISQAAKTPQRKRLQLVLLQGGKAGSTAWNLNLPRMSTQNNVGKSYDPALPAAYGMTPDDLKLMGFNAAIELGRSIVDVIALPDENGKATVTLGNHYPVEISYKDERSPYLIVNAKIMDDTSKDPLAENTILVDKDKPAFLGVSNLTNALILVITRQPDPPTE